MTSVFDISHRAIPLKFFIRRKLESLIILSIIFHPLNIWSRLHFHSVHDSSSLFRHTWKNWLPIIHSHNVGIIWVHWRWIINFMKRSILTICLQSVHFWFIVRRLINFHLCFHFWFLLNLVFSRFNWYSCLLQFLFLWLNHFALWKKSTRSQFYITCFNLLLFNYWFFLRWWFRNLLICSRISIRGNANLYRSSWRRDGVFHWFPSWSILSLWRRLRIFLTQNVIFIRIVACHWFITIWLLIRLLPSVLFLFSLRKLVVVRFWYFFLNFTSF